MTQDFLLIHRSGPDRLATSSHEVFSFMTCLRHVVVAESDVLEVMTLELRPGDTVMRGEEAYRFILEVICGLHSPLVGETEVYGQFKTAVGAFQFPATPWGSQLAKTFKTLFEDAKKIRDAHLKDLGSQSYGSVLRREVRGLKQLHILGSGHLVQEILPWVTKDTLQITIHCRDVEKAKLQLAKKLEAVQLARIQIMPLNQRMNLSCADALVIAAPVDSAWIRDWLPQITNLKFVADLRADSSVDRLHQFARVLELGEFMSRLSENQTVLIAKKSLALNAVAKAAFDRTRTVEYRPFGWDDVSA